MKQHVTVFKKSTPRQLALLFLGLGFVGMALTVGGPEMGMAGLSSIGAIISVVSFLLATLMGTVAGGIPVPYDTEPVEVEERVQVQLSDELQADIKARVDEVLEQVQSENAEIISKATYAAESLTEKIEKLETQLRELNIDSVASQLHDIGSKTERIDADAAVDAIEQLESGVQSVNSHLADLSNLSSTESEKLENTIEEVSDNLNALLETFKAMENQVNRSLKQFENFNSL